MCTVPRPALRSWPLALSLLAALLPLRALVAEEIYRYVDKDGKEHFSTSPQTGSSKAQLPEVRRENFADRIERVRSETPPNCDKRGGVDCARGADVDGSVICMDGFAGSTLAFETRCGVIRLQADAPRVLDTAGQPLDLTSRDAANAARSVILTVRSLSALPAENVRVELTFPRLPNPLLAEGPATVDPYGFAEYTAHLDPIRTYLTRENLKKLVIRVKCSKCTPETETLR